MNNYMYRKFLKPMPPKIRTIRARLKHGYTRYTRYTTTKSKVNATYRIKYWNTYYSRQKSCPLGNKWLYYKLLNISLYI